MICLSFIPLILAIYQHAKIVKCAYVNISLSATSVRVLVGHVNVELVDMHPACCTSAFKNLFLRATVFGGYTYQLAKYDKTYKVFRLVTPVPSDVPCSTNYSWLIADWPF
eukprot:Seg6783.1 transcript_id=Seg6783.1/GoldUCD/mRNA.D3Y31 product="hypothetical protein" protein_id=Seg6783.1/GoldUCD/D3Y31